ncbi:MAG: inorganic pyrophosphatase [Candidatus Parcubacteria bacterium]|nr:MAG: inorganic pyrophosphatase [Candidatus Parcubacteria bacterium]
MELEVFIEISKNSSVKYEFDKEKNILKVDRFLYTAMFFPFNYGFIVDTQGEDGDPVDALILSEFSILPGSLIKCQPIGGLEMEDESGNDEKIIVVPLDKIDPFWSKYKSINQLEESYKNKIRHFFENYKTLEPNKWVKINNWFDYDKAVEIIKKSLIKK